MAAGSEQANEHGNAQCHVSAFLEPDLLIAFTHPLYPDKHHHFWVKYIQCLRPPWTTSIWKHQLQFICVHLPNTKQSDLTKPKPTPPVTIQTCVALSQVTNFCSKQYQRAFRETFSFLLSSWYARISIHEWCWFAVLFLRTAFIWLTYQCWTCFIKQ